jgi:hypothetical protein
MQRHQDPVKGDAAPNSSDSPLTAQVIEQAASALPATSRRAFVFPSIKKSAAPNRK